MFEEMRESRSAGLFVLGPDVIPDLKVDHRRRMIFMRDDAKAVGKGCLGKIQMPRTGRICSLRPRYNRCGDNKEQAGNESTHSADAILPMVRFQNACLKT